MHTHCNLGVRLRRQHRCLVTESCMAPALCRRFRLKLECARTSGSPADGLPSVPLILSCPVHFWSMNTQHSIVVGEQLLWVSARSISLLASTPICTLRWSSLSKQRIARDGVCRLQVLLCSGFWIARDLARSRLLPCTYSWDSYSWGCRVLV